MQETQVFTIQIEECEHMGDIHESLRPIRDDITVLRSRICDETETGFALVRSSQPALNLYRAFSNDDVYVTIHTGDQIDDLYRQERLNYVI